MRSDAIHITFNPVPSLNGFLHSYKNANGQRIDYERSSKKGKYVIYFHDDDAFAYAPELLQYYESITGVENYIRPINGLPTDYIELYYETLTPQGIEGIEWFEAGGKFYQNVSFARLTECLGFTLYTRPEIVNNITENLASDNLYTNE